MTGRDAGGRGPGEALVNRLADAAHREGKASTDYYGYREQVNAGEEAELAGQALLSRLAALETALDRIAALPETPTPFDPPPPPEIGAGIWVGRTEAANIARAARAGETGGSGQMRVYLAARYGRREELCRYRAELEADGHTVTSRWIDGEHQVYQGAPLGRDYERQVEAGDTSTVPLRAHFAAEDYGDVLAADVVVSFTERPRAEASRGGRHVEFGVALAHNKRVLVVGHRENVFHCLPQVEFYRRWEDARRALLGERAAWDAGQDDGASGLAGDGRMTGRDAVPVPAGGEGPDAEDVALVDAFEGAVYAEAASHTSDLSESIPLNEAALAARDALLARIIRLKVALKVAHRALAEAKGASDDRD